MAMDLECLVVGGGAAGTAAAQEVAASGADVVVIEAGKTLAHPIDASGVTVLTSSLAWAAFPGGVVSVVTPGESVDFVPRAIILATGAEDRLLPFRGWEHRLVVTAAEAIALARAHDVRLRWVIAGNGDHGIGIALALKALDQDVALYAEASTADVRMVRAAGIETLAEYVLAGVSGDEHLDAIEFRPLGGHGEPVRRKGDMLCVAYARSPAAELAWLAGCRMAFRPTLGGYVPLVGDAVVTTVDGVFVAGALAGLCGAETAALEGRLAGQAAAAHLGKRQGSAEAARLSRITAQVRAAREREAQAPWITHMWELEDRYVREALHHPDGLLCRCEKVRGAAVQAVLADAGAHPSDVKRATRAGMGECQGRHCRLLVASAVAAATGRPREETIPMTFRPPVRPITLGELVRTGD